MAVQDKFKTALITPAKSSRGLLYDGLSAANIYVITETPTDLIAPALCTHVAYLGVIFRYDPSDTTSAHDGVTVIVTDGGRRFKADQFGGNQRRRFVVLDKDLAAPPGSPVLGASYIVAAGASGAWTGQSKRIASFTSRGWMFQVPNAYDDALVIDEDLLYHYSSGGSWTVGSPGLTTPTSGIGPSQVRYPFGIAVINQTTTAPPGSPANGDAYIVGASATGAWLGQDRKLVIRESGSWVFYTPQNGWMVWDASRNLAFWYQSLVWRLPDSGASRWVTIDDTTIAAAIGSKVYTGLGAYKVLRFTLEGVRVSTNTEIVLQPSVDGGGTWINSGYQHASSGADNYLRPVLNTLESAGAGLSGQWQFLNFNTTLKGSWFGYGMADITAGYPIPAAVHYTIAATAVRNAMRLYPLAGSIIAGRIILEGSPT